jgi:hypothetical protein
MMDALADAVSEETLLAMYKFLMEYRDLIPDYLYLLKKIESKLTRPHIAVEPTLQNLFEHQVFIYTNETGKKYSIPLWHHTLLFDDLIVTCTPKTGSLDVWVDDANNVHTTVHAPASVILAAGELTFDVGPKRLRIASSELGLVPMQTQVLRQQGIPWPDPEEMLNVVRLSDIFVHVHLTV